LFGKYGYVIGYLRILSYMPNKFQKPQDVGGFGITYVKFFDSLT